MRRKRERLRLILARVAIDGVVGEVPPPYSVRCREARRPTVKPAGNAGDTLRLARGPRERQCSELVRPRFQPAFPLGGDDRQGLLDDCLSFCETAAVPEPPPRVPERRDPSDRKFLELALAGQADALVTGDGDLLALAEEFCVPILSAAAFGQMLSRREGTAEA